MKFSLKKEEETADRIGGELCFILLVLMKITEHPMETVKKLFITIFFCIFSFYIYAADSSFNSFAGASIDIIPNQGEAPSLLVKGVYEGQYNISNRFLFRGNFFVRTDNIIESGLFQDTPAYFTINELSAGFRFSANTVTQQLTFFIGSHESFGSDDFLSQHLGTKGVGSALLTPMLSLSSISMYDYSGFGMAYDIKLAAPVAFGFYCYYDKKFDYKNINGDFRLAAAGSSAIVDIGAGLTLPVETEDDAGNEVFLLIRRADFHGGFSILLGNNPITNLFIQAGVLRIQTKPLPDMTMLSLDDLYLFVEPRFTTEYLNCSISFFCMPEERVKNLSYITQPIGCDLKLETPDFMAFKTGATAGIHFSVSSPSLSSGFSMEKLDFQVSPYLNVKILSGTLDAAVFIHPLAFSDISKLFSFTAGYKVCL